MARRSRAGKNSTVIDSLPPATAQPDGGAGLRRAAVLNLGPALSLALGRHEQVSLMWPRVAHTGQNAR